MKFSVIKLTIMYMTFNTSYKFTGLQCDTLVPIIIKCPNYQGAFIFQVSLYNKAPFGIIIKCVAYTSILIFKYPGFTVY